MKKGPGRLGAVCHCVKLTVPHPRERRTLVTLASDLQLSPPSNSGISGVNPIKDWSLLVFNLRDPIKVCSKKVSVHERTGIVPMPSEGLTRRGDALALSARARTTGYNHGGIPHFPGSHSRSSRMANSWCHKKIHN